MHTTKWHLPLAGEKCESSVGSVSFSPLLFSPVSHPPCPSLSRRTMHVHHAAPRQLVIITLNYRYPHVGDTQRHRCASRPRFIRRVLSRGAGCNKWAALFFQLIRWTRRFSISISYSLKKKIVLLRNFYYSREIERDSDPRRAYYKVSWKLSPLKIPNLRLITTRASYKKKKEKRNPTAYRIRNGIEPRSIILPFIYLEWNLG